MINENCCLCGKALKERVCFNNFQEDQTFIFIPLDSSAHLECYIAKIIEDKFKELVNGLNL